MNIISSRFVYFGAMKSKQTHEIFHLALVSVSQGTERGWQAALARKTDISPVIINEILKGKRPGTEEQRRSIAEGLGYNYEDFLNLARNTDIEKPGTKNELESPSEETIFIGTLDPGNTDLELLSVSLEKRIKNPDLPPKEKQNLKKLLALAEKILSSNHVVEREALRSNIVAFAENLDRTMEIKEITSELMDSRKKMKSMEVRLKALESIMSKNHHETEDTM